MTIQEINLQIKELQNMLKEKEREFENLKDEIIGRYYKCGNAIGMIVSRSEEKNKYICNELYFYDPECGGISELQHDTYTENTLDDIELITQEDFEDRFNRRIKKLRNIFKLN